MENRIIKNKRKIFRLILDGLTPTVFKNLYLMLRFSCFVHPFARIKFINNLTIGRGTIIGRCDICAQGPIKIGRNCLINDYVIINSKTGYINIGESTAVNNFSVIYGNGGVDIGKNCAIAHSVKIVKNHVIPKRKTDSYSKSTELYTKIGNNVWLCANVVIIDGVKIGNYSIIGANSLVLHDLPESIVAGGNPAKILKKRKYKK